MAYIRSSFGQVFAFRAWQQGWMSSELVIRVLVAWMRCAPQFTYYIRPSDRYPFAHSPTLTDGRDGPFLPSPPCRLTCRSLPGPDIRTSELCQRRWQPQLVRSRHSVRQPTQLLLCTSRRVRLPHHGERNCYCAVDIET